MKRNSSPRTPAFLSGAGLVLALILATKSAFAYFDWQKVTDLPAPVAFDEARLKQGLAGTALSEPQRNLLLEMVHQQQSGRIAATETLQRSAAWWRDYALTTAVESMVLGWMFVLLFFAARNASRPA